MSGNSGVSALPVVILETTIPEDDINCGFADVTVTFSVVSGCEEGDNKSEESEEHVFEQECIISGVPGVTGFDGVFNS